MREQTHIDLAGAVGLHAPQAKVWLVAEEARLQLHQIHPTHIERAQHVFEARVAQHRPLRRPCELKRLTLGVQGAAHRQIPFPRENRRPCGEGQAWVDMVCGARREGSRKPGGEGGAL